MDDKKKLINEAGAPVPDNENAITAGRRGPVVMQDVWLMKKMAHFNREVIPERRMHAKGWGAYGKFTVTHDISMYTKAKALMLDSEQVKELAALSNDGLIGATRHP